MAQLVVAGLEGEEALRNCQGRVGGDDVDMVFLDDPAFRRFGNLQRGLLRQNFPQHARMVRVQMLNEEKRHAAVRGKIGEQLGNGFQPTREAPIPTIGKELSGGNSGPLTEVT